MQDVLVCRNASLDVSWWPRSKSWGVFPQVPHGATGVHPPVAWARAILQSGVSVPLGIPASRARQSPARPDEPLIRDATPPWDTGPAKDELYAALWIWRRRARGCRDGGGRARCPAPAGRRSSALANACGRSAGACWWPAGCSRLNPGYVGRGCARLLVAQDAACSRIAGLGDGGNAEPDPVAAALAWL